MDNMLSSLVVMAKFVVKKKTLKYLCNNKLRKKVKVLVYGASGVGKTQFVQTIIGKNVYDIPMRTYNTTHYEFSLSSGRKILLIDTPGQGRSGTAIPRIDELETMANGKIDGIINLVNFGYQDSEEVKKNRMLAFENDKDAIKSSYIEENQKLEIKYSKEIFDRLNRNVRPKWIMTVVNKADIWDSERENVIRYYNEGNYANTFRDKLGLVTHTVHPFCSIITPFGGRPMTLTYGEQDKYKDWKAFFKGLEENIQGYHGEH